MSNPRHRISTWLESCTKHAMDFVFPVQCALCGTKEFLSDAKLGCYCHLCIEELSPRPINRCQCCGAEIGLYAQTADGCTHCRNRTLRFESVVCLGMYEGSLRQAILAAKWSFSAVRMRSLGKLLAQQRQRELQELRIDRVVPIPQHWRQRLVRHFNPAWIIAEEIAAQLNVPCDAQLLSRQRRTRAQKRVAVSQRFSNQTDSFAVKSCSAEGQRLLIVDDVLTSGATCSEAARLLKRCHAASCHAAVLGRVLDHSA